MLAATFMHAILNAIFFDFDFDFIVLVLYTIIASIVFGAIVLGLAYGFHPDATAYYVTCVIYGIPEPIPVVTIKSDDDLPVELADDYRPAVSALQWYGPRKTQPEQTERLGAEGATQMQPITPYVPNSVRYTSVRDLPVARQPTINYDRYSFRPLPQTTSTTPIALSVRRLAPTQEQFSWWGQAENVRPVALVAPPLPTTATQTPPPLTLEQLQEVALARLRSATTHTLQDADVCLQHSLAVDSKYWNVIDTATGGTIGVIDQASQVGQGILTLAIIHARANIKPFDPIFITLRTYAFEPLPLNSDGSYPKITPPLHFKYLLIRDQDDTHTSIIWQDSRLFKALRLFASGDFITSPQPEPLAQLPNTAAPTDNGLPFTTELPMDSTYGGILVMVTPAPAVEQVTPHPIPTVISVPAEDIIANIPAANPVNTTIAPTGPLILTDAEMTNAEPITAVTDMIVTTPTVTAGSVMSDVAPMAGNDAAVTDDTASTILADPAVTDGSSVTAPIVIAPVSPFPHTELTARDRVRFQETTPAPDTSEQFDGPCTVSWTVPSGGRESSPLNLEIRRFIDADLFIPLNKSIYNFKRLDGALVGSFIILATTPSFRNSEGLSTFPFRFQRVGSEDSQEDLHITMIDAVANEFNLMTGHALPPKEALTTANIPTQATSLPSHTPPVFTSPALVPTLAPPVATASHLPPSATAAAPDFALTAAAPEVPAAGTIYTAPCSIVRPTIRVRSPDTLYYRYMATGSVGGWEFSLTPKAKGVKRVWSPLLPSDSHWESARNGDGRRLMLTGMDMKSPGRTHRVSLEMSEANAAKFCRLARVPQAALSNEQASGSAQPAASTSVSLGVRTSRTPRGAAT
ncbi:hypothetical protein FRB98_005418 [Tulasnella sp. 332]|nr:hypothetical protein FRB98_005418 [Tulasnella sp. 332]